MSLLNLHIASIFCAVGVILLADHEAFLWMRGKKQVLSVSRMKLLHYAMWAVLLALITTGTLLFLPRYDYLLSQPLFVIKLLFVAILVVNAILIGNLMHVATKQSFASLSQNQKLELFMSGTISVFSWASVTAIGLYLFY
jgi:hypothetical protein